MINPDLSITVRHTIITVGGWFRFKVGATMWVRIKQPTTITNILCKETGMRCFGSTFRFNEEKKQYEPDKNSYTCYCDIEALSWKSLTEKLKNKEKQIIEKFTSLKNGENELLRTNPRDYTVDVVLDGKTPIREMKEEE
jgi:hypothetical protein